MLKPLVAVYREAGRFALACPLLFLVPVAAEGLQHVAEHAIGFYAGRAQAHAVADSPVRMAFGTVKIVALFLTGYWVVRWIEWGDAARVARAEPAARRTFLPFLLFELLFGLPQIWGGTALAAMHVTPPGWVLPSIAVAALLVDMLTMDWRAAAPVGDGGSGPFRSTARIAPVLPWAVAFEIVAVLPAMAVHYALGYGAMAAPGPAKVALLAADTLFVGYLGAVVAAVPWFISRHARSRVEARAGARIAPAAA